MSQLPHDPDTNDDNRNANKFCDINEGVAGLTVYITNSGGQILGQTLTDTIGVAQFTIRAPASAQLAISGHTWGVAIRPGHQPAHATDRDRSLNRASGVRALGDIE